MHSNATICRRAVLATLIASPFAFRTAAADAPRRMVVTKDPSCGCCSAWVEHIRSAGFSIEVVETPDISRVKARLGVPQNLASCHTAEIDRYVIEGHVPADAIKRLLAEQPHARGLAVPGMPAGSPGMEVPDMEPQTFEVVLFGPSGQRSFARYKGNEPL
ncbi:DUF411 domain-containing protein [Microvirga pakistanensis]|uniref:DUF411 domain-containing protein n=1 Tax=Microvirga pakistanensis TaxID=1682650 RepID=UPI001069888F|nr:DUF411 domain-containing protein [Microvirga pakistanensis]